MRTLRGRVAGAFALLALAILFALGGVLFVLLRDLHAEANSAALSDLAVPLVSQARLRIQQGVRLRAATNQGLYRGIAALLRLIRESSFDLQGQRSIHLPFCSTLDYPAFPFRAFHMMITDRREIAFYRQVIREAFLHRFNTVIVEFGLNMELASHPELTDPVKTLSREEMQSLITLASHYALEVIPAVNSCGHQPQKLFDRYPDFYWNVAGQNPESAAFDHGNPGVRAIYFDAYRETIDLFKPRYFHIGHDEVVALKSFPAKNAAEIFADNVRVFHGFLAERGIKTMMWGDMLLKGDVTGVQDMIHGGMFHTAGALDLLPRDIIILDCHYRQENPEFRSSTYFIGKGFTVVGATFDDAVTTRNFAAYLGNLQRGVKGMCATVSYRLQWRHLTVIREILAESERAFWGRGGVTSFHRAEKG